MSARDFLKRKQREQSIGNGMKFTSTPPSAAERRGIRSGFYTGAGADGQVQPWKTTETRMDTRGRPYQIDEGEVAITNASTVQAYGGAQNLDDFIQRNRPQMNEMLGARDMSVVMGAENASRMPFSAKERARTTTVNVDGNAINGGMRKFQFGGTTLGDVPGGALSDARNSLYDPLGGSEFSSLLRNREQPFGGIPEVATPALPTAPTMSGTRWTQTSQPQAVTARPQSVQILPTTSQPRTVAAPQPQSVTTQPQSVQAGAVVKPAPVSGTPMGVTLYPSATKTESVAKPTITGTPITKTGTVAKPAPVTGTPMSIPVKDYAAAAGTTAAGTIPTSRYNRPAVTAMSEYENALLNQVLAKMGASQNSERAAEAQNLLQSGYSPDEVVGMLAKSDVSRREAIGGAAGEFAGTAATTAEQRRATQQSFEEGRREFEKTQGLAERTQGFTEKKYEDAKSERMASDAQTMDLASWQAKYPGSTEAQYNEGRRSVNQNEFDQYLASGNFPLAAKKWKEMTGEDLSTEDLQTMWQNMVDRDKTATASSSWGLLNTKENALVTSIGQGANEEAVAEDIRQIIADKRGVDPSEVTDPEIHSYYSGYQDFAYGRAHKQEQFAVKYAQYEQHFTDGTSAEDLGAMWDELYDEFGDEYMIGTKPDFEAIADKIKDGTFSTDYNSNQSGILSAMSAYSPSQLPETWDEFTAAHPDDALMAWMEKQYSLVHPNEKDEAKKAAWMKDQYETLATQYKQTNIDKALEYVKSTYGEQYFDTTAEAEAATRYLQNMLLTRGMYVDDSGNIVTDNEKLLTQPWDAPETAHLFMVNKDGSFVDGWTQTKFNARDAYVKAHKDDTDILDLSTWETAYTKALTGLQPDGKVIIDGTTYDNFESAVDGVGGKIVEEKEPEVDFTVANLVDDTEGNTMYSPEAAEWNAPADDVQRLTNELITKYTGSLPDGAKPSWEGYKAWYDKTGFIENLPDFNTAGTGQSKIDFWLNEELGRFTPEQYVQMAEKAGYSSSIPDDMFGFLDVAKGYFDTHNVHGQEIVDKWNANNGKLVVIDGKPYAIGGVQKTLINKRDGIYSYEPVLIDLSQQPPVDVKYSAIKQ